LVWKLDRLSRSLKDLIDLWEKLNHKKIDLITHDSSIDTTTPWWKMMFQILGVFSEFNRALIVQNVKAWIQKAKEKWVHVWRPKTTHKIYTPTLLKKALQLKREWLSYRKIANQLNIENYSRLAKEMKSKSYYSKL
jgi:DNA invertase Pin-like site-specific DNA recombinase